MHLIHKLLIPLSRIQLAALHFNENSNQKQAITKKGERQFSIVFPKYKKGGYIVKKVTEEATYGKKTINKYNYFV